MDDVILRGIGGYATRAEFIVDAIQERIYELAIEAEEDPDGPLPSQQRVWTPRPQEPPRTSPEGIDTTASPGPDELATALEVPRRGLAMEPYEVAIDDDVLFGLHNRDYPSLWALAHLASMAQQRPVPAETFYAEVLEEAWRFGKVLLDRERRGAQKCTALFPTNPRKVKAAEAAFRAFAIGDYRIADDGLLTAHGPLFVWRAAALSMNGEGPSLGLTDAGWDLLAAVDGLTVDQPHPSEVARRFFEHLSRYAPADWDGFTVLLSSIGAEGATRADVLERFAEVWPEWSPNEVSTNATGYTARAREWGLVEPKQTKGRYHLTPFGLEVAAAQQDRS